MEEKVIELDCRELIPCEPMERVLRAMETLKGGETIKMINLRVPHPLFPILATRGFCYKVQEFEEKIEVFIWKNNSPD
ncbi:MAG: DUF2249 domain-containing protein [Leptospiraceae bacterium]|nr:DUF2249 domain-containing protein [Leptospiraceae bacterium]MCP5494388.1 DUF2249 domain-containing protein [Leptospiraceae bacterium]